MFLKALTLIFFIVLISRSAEFSFVQPIEGKMYVDDYFNSLGMPDIEYGEICVGEPEECWYYIKNQDGLEIDQRYNGKQDTLTFLGKARYRENAYLFVKRSYRIGNLSDTEYFLIDQYGDKLYFNVSLPWKKLAVFPLINKNILVITEEAVIEFSPEGEVLRIPLPRPVEFVYVGNSPDGLVSMVAAGDNDLVFMNYRGEQTQFIVDPNVLSTYGDRMGILSIYPDSETVSYSAIYRYMNPYNKGLVFYYLDFSRGTFIKGFLFNSEDRNIGFDPSVYSTQEEVVVSAKNSSEGGYVHFVIPKGEVAKIEGAVPEHIRGFEGEKTIEFQFSARTSLLTWKAGSAVKKDDVTYAEATYDMSNSLFYGISMEGRVGKTQLAVSYLRNKAEEKGGLTAKVSEYISAVVDFNELIGKRRTLRIGYEKGRVNGIARFKSGSTSRYTVFETDLTSYYGYLMMERGLYQGIEYYNYKIPSAVGFSDWSGAIAYYDFDPNFTLYSLLLLVGYDKVSYARRYETNLNDFYFAGNLGIGIGYAKVSKEIEDKAKTSTGATSISVPVYTLFKAYGELGYIYQRRAKVFKGLGFSINLGYRLTLLRTMAESEGGSDPNKLFLEFERYDVLHGPFLQGNLIF